MGEFELARRVAVRMMETRAFAKGIEVEDRRMVAYIPQLRRLNELGMITFNSQSGTRDSVAHYQTGKMVAFRERAYCCGFVDASVADAVITWMWDNTDKYVARAIDVEEVSRGDKSLYAVLSGFGNIGVSQRTYEGAVTWPSRVAHVVMPADYECNYGHGVYPEQRGKPPDALGEEAIRHVGPYMKHPVPRSAVCLLCVDMRLDRRADARDGLFSQLERALRAARRSVPTGPERPERPERPAKVGPKSEGPQTQNAKRDTRNATISTKAKRRKARGATRSPCAGERKGRCARARRADSAPRSRSARRAGSRGARRS